MMSWKYVKTLDGPSVIPHIEAKLGVKFPLSYVECATINNGGRPEHTRISDDFAVKALVRIDENADLNLTKTKNILSDRLPEKMIAFANDSFGNYFCFDFASSNEPKVVFWDHEDNSITVVANSFDEFLSLLK